LASCVVTEKPEVFDYFAQELQTWNVFWNKIPTSYPFLPYGGIKDSGYWKELGERGMKNFTNEKVIVEGEVWWVREISDEKFWWYQMRKDKISRW
jgi:succinate-semialdehyde dehydrogenase/glutarate-semialdehyde dehydrogenase